MWFWRMQCWIWWTFISLGRSIIWYVREMCGFCSGKDSVADRVGPLLSRFILCILNKIRRINIVPIPNEQKHSGLNNYKRTYISAQNMFMYLWRLEECRKVLFPIRIVVECQLRVMPYASFFLLKKGGLSELSKPP